MEKINFYSFDKSIAPGIKEACYAICEENLCINGGTLDNPTILKKGKLSGMADNSRLPNTVCVLSDDNCVLGYASFAILPSSELYIRQIAIKSTEKRKKYGTKILNSLYEINPDIIAEVRIDNIESQNFFISNEFNFDDKRLTQSGKSYILYSKKLAEKLGIIETHNCKY